MSLIRYAENLGLFVAFGILADLADTRAEIAALGDEPQGVVRGGCLSSFGRHTCCPYSPAC